MGQVSLMYDFAYQRDLVSSKDSVDHELRLRCPVETKASKRLVDRIGLGT